MNIKKSILLRIRIAFLVIFLLSAGVIYRIVRVQYVDGDKWRHLANTIGVKMKTVPATRGNIYSDNGSLLATSLPFYRVAFDPYLASDGLYKSNIDSLSYLLSNFYKDLTPSQYKRKINNARQSKRRYLVLNRKEIGYQEKRK
jgi:cell division protein FtsI (penicillin-binding protein 3)